MEDPDPPERHRTIQLSAALAGGAAARGRQLALLQAVVATAAAAVDVRQDGDALRVRFTDPLAAARCAIELQQRVEADNRTAAEPGVLRIAAAAPPARAAESWIVLCRSGGSGSSMPPAPWKAVRGQHHDGAGSDGGGAARNVRRRRPSRGPSVNRAERVIPVALRCRVSLSSYASRA